MNLFANRRLHASTGERRVTWLELFFDLVTIVAISRLGIQLHNDHSLGGVLAFTGLLVVVWWVWISYSYVADIFDNDSVFDRLVQLFGMAGLAIVALTLPGSQTASPFLFAAANVGLFVVLAVVYFISGKGEQRARELSRWYVAGSLTGAGLWAISLFIDASWQPYLWGAAVFANALISGPIAYARMRQAPRQNSHMPERFGLFLIIVLGEVMLATVNSIAEVQLHGSGIIIGLAGFIIAATIWWIYFDHFDGKLITKAIQHGPGAQVRSFVYGYGHLLLYAAIVVIGIGIELAIEHDGASEPLIGIGVAGVMGGFLLTSIGRNQSVNYPFLILKALIMAVAIFLAVAAVPAAWVCSILAALLVLLILFEYRHLQLKNLSATV